MLVAPLMGSAVHADSQNQPQTQVASNHMVGSANPQVGATAQASKQPTTTTQANGQNNQNGQTPAGANGANNQAQNKNQGPKKPLTPQQKAQLKKQRAAIMKQIKALNAKQRARMLKVAQPLFLIKGKGKRAYVYKMMAVLGKKGQATPVPNTTKKFMPMKKFQRYDIKELSKARVMGMRAKRTRNKQLMKKANQLFMDFIRIAHMNTPAKNQKSNSNNKAKNNRKINKRSKRYNKRSHRSNKRGRRRSRKSRKNNRHSKSFTAKEGNNYVKYLKSKYRRGNRKALRRSGFANGSTFSRGLIRTMFDRYAPNSRRAVIPRRFRIYKVNLNKGQNQPATVWLVGRRTRNINKINHMHQAYYYRYNKQYGGWANIGYNGKD